ncbi:MAG: DNA-processing protein DprA [Nitrospiraceae bacterium]|nr:DNA-processing protein DprA [Nitrospiraceae bacterium]
MVTLDSNNYACLASMDQYLGDQAPHTVNALGNPEILSKKSLALFCSNKCPGKIIIQTYDFVRELRDLGATIISGFHSAIERECCAILLRGSQPIIYCPARSVDGMTLKPEFKKPLDEGRLLILSPFHKKHRRISADLADRRNHFVAALAAAVVVPYAAPGSKTEKFCSELRAWNKGVYTFSDSSPELP